MISIPARLREAAEERRRLLRETIKRAVLADFVVDGKDAAGPGRFAIRRTHVYRSVASQLRIALISNAFGIEVIAAVVDLGGIATRVGNRRMFRGVHHREICPAQAGVEARELRSQATGKSGKGGKEGKPRSWEDMLAAEGMPAELGAVRLVDPRAATLNAHRITKAADAFWKVDREHVVLRLYMEGASIRDLEERTGIKRHALHRLLHKHGLTDADGADV